MMDTLIPAARASDVPIKIARIITNPLFATPRECIFLVRPVIRLNTGLIRRHVVLRTHATAEIRETVFALRLDHGIEAIECREEDCFRMFLRDVALTR